MIDKIIDEMLKEWSGIFILLCMFVGIVIFTFKIIINANKSKC
jgi:hypothetical protein